MDETVLVSETFQINEGERSQGIEQSYLWNAQNRKRAGWWYCKRTSKKYPQRWSKDNQPEAIAGEK